MSADKDALEFLELARAAEAFFAAPGTGLREVSRLATPARAGKNRLLGAAAVQLSWAAEEAERFDLTGEPEFVQASVELRGAAQGLLASLKKKSEGPLLDAKRRAAEAERLCRLARRRAFGEPNAVRGLKLEGVCRRFSQASEGVQKAADAVAGLLAAQA